MVLALDQMMHLCAKNGITVTLAPRVGESLICRARNNSVADFINKDHDYLFTLDDDIDPPLDTLISLIKCDKDIVGGFYRLKVKDNPLTAVRLPRGDDDPTYDVVLKGNMLVPAQYVSTGCMLVKRHVIEAMWHHYTELHYTQNASDEERCALYMPFIHEHPDGFREYLSEDWAFCQRALSIGFEVWADGSIKCGHWGAVRYAFGE